MGDYKNETTTEEWIEMIEDGAKFLVGFIEGLTAAATLQGLSQEEVYKIEKIYATATNIRCYCTGIRDNLDKLNKTSVKKENEK